MSLKTSAASALAGLGPFRHGQRDLTISEADARLDARLSSLDALALAFDHITLVRGDLSNDSIERLKQVADDLSKRLTYLLEPISPIEVDLDQCVVQMRSNPPQRDDNGTRYYELLVRRGGELSLRRFEKQPGGARQAIPAEVTREVFLRVVGDLAETG